MAEHRRCGPCPHKSSSLRFGSSVVITVRFSVMLTGLPQGLIRRGRTTGFTTVPSSTMTIRSL